MTLLQCQNPALPGDLLPENTEGVYLTYIPQQIISFVPHRSV